MCLHTTCEGFDVITCKPCDFERVNAWPSGLCMSKNFLFELSCLNCLASIAVCFQAVQKLIDCGAKIETADKKGWTPLFFACR